MTTLMGKNGDEHTMMTVGLGVVGSLYSFGNDYRLSDASPLAQLMSEPEGVLVPGDSPYETIDDLVQAWKADPSSVAVGGGSSPGGPDHLFPMQLAQTVGIDPNDVNYVSYDGGGPLTSALLGSKIKVGFSGLAEFEGQIESGELRVLAVSGDERLPQDTFADVPTLTESGIDLVFLNWRGVLAPPGISDERRDELVGFLQTMHDSDGLAAGADGQRLDRRLQDRCRLRDVHRGAGRPRLRHLEGAGTAVTTPAVGGRTKDRVRRPGAVRPGRRSRHRRHLDDRRRPGSQRRLRRPDRPAGLPLRGRRRDGRARRAARGGHESGQTSPSPRPARTST